MLEDTIYGSQDHGMDPPDTKASKPREDCKSLRVSWLRGWIARNASKHKTFAGSQGDSGNQGQHPGGLSMDEGLDSPITMLQNTKHASQDHGKASNPLEDCKWMRGWIARKAAKRKAWSAGAWTAPAGQQGQQAPAGGR